MCIIIDLWNLIKRLSKMKCRVELRKSRLVREQTKWIQVLHGEARRRSHMTSLGVQFNRFSVQVYLNTYVVERYLHAMLGEIRNSRLKEGIAGKCYGAFWYSIGLADLNLLNCYSKVHTAKRLIEIRRHQSKSLNGYQFNDKYVAKSFA